jgi:hypothetical protein
MAQIYLDYNASTPIDPAVAAAMRPFLDEAFGNPSSGHWASTPAKAALGVEEQETANCRRFKVGGPPKLEDDCGLQHPRDRTPELREEDPPRWACLVSDDVGAEVGWTSMRFRACQTCYRNLCRNLQETESSLEGTVLAHHSGGLF